MKRWLIVGGILLVGPSAFAFPDMVRHGYVNCNSCHTTMVGGGLLNEYGRTLSREILSQPSLTGFASTEGDEKFAYGLVKTPPWLLLGGDIRLLQFFSESKAASRARFLVMQVELEASAQLAGYLRVFFSAGRVDKPKADNPSAVDFVASPRHGLEFSLTSPEAVNRVTWRTGRFMPAYGIAFAEHTFFTRTLLDFQPGQERYASELAWANDHSSVIATAIFSQTDDYNIKRDEKLKSEKGGAMQWSTALREKSKVGVNYYQTQRETNKNVRYTRRMLGAFGHFSFDRKWYGLAEINRVQGADQKWGVVEIFKLGYEIQQGLHFIGAQEFANLNLENSNPKADAYSIGVEWFPRPHFDFYAVYRRERDTSRSNDFQDVIWLVGHFYL